MPMHILVALVVALLAAVPASAQIAPTEAELRTYGGLHAAAARGDVVDMEKRIGSGENKEAIDTRNRTPLHVAVYQKKHDAAHTLIRLGADPNKLEIDRYDIITIAAVANDVPMLRIVLEGGGNPKAITSRYDGTALIAAAHLGHAEVVRMLIAAGAPLDHVNNLQWTALIESIVLGDGGRNQPCAHWSTPVPTSIFPTAVDRRHSGSQEIAAIRRWLSSWKTPARSDRPAAEHRSGGRQPIFRSHASTSRAAGTTRG